jgi:hypothetical protein
VVDWLQMIHEPERVEAIRERRALAMQSVTTMEAQIKDPGFRERLQLVRHMLDDVESFFLGSLTRESLTPVREAYWLRQAEMFLAVIIMPQLKVLQDSFAKFGPTVTLV